MAVLKEWICFGHGRFESISSKCPHGCTTTEQRFYTPPAIRSDSRTANIDKTLDGLMKEHKLTDIRSAKEGEAVKQVSQKKIDEVNNFNQEFAARYGSNSGWGNLNPQNLTKSLQSLGVKHDNTFNQVKSALKPLNEMTIPIRDPQALKLEANK